MEVHRQEKLRKCVRLYQLLVDYLSKADIMEGKKKFKKMLSTT